MTTFSPSSPTATLPRTRFRPGPDPAHSDFHELTVEAKKERETIQGMPYRTTQLVFPNPKVKPDFVKTRFGSGGNKRSASFRGMERGTLISNLTPTTALVHRQGINPAGLYSDQNIKEAISVQTGGNVQPYQQMQQQQMQMQMQQLPYQQIQQIQQHRPLHQQRQPPAASSSRLSAPVQRVPDATPEYKPQNSPTYRAVLELEGPGMEMPAPTRHDVGPPKTGHAHHTAPSHQLNSVGMPSANIAQSGSFKRLMWHVMGDF